MDTSIKDTIKRANALLVKALQSQVSNAEVEELKSIEKYLFNMGYKPTVVDTFYDKYYRKIKYFRYPTKKASQFKCKFSYTNVRPIGYTGDMGDCTTRSIAYVLNKPYEEVKTQQLAICSDYKTLHGIYRMMKSYDYVQIGFREALVLHKVWDKVQDLFGDCGMLCYSTDHLVAIDKEGVHDTFDSRLRRVLGMFVHKSAVKKVYFALEAYIIRSHTIDELIKEG